MIFSAYGAILCFEVMNMAKPTKEQLYDRAIVAKRNVLNEIRSTSMTVQELRFFSIYLSKIKPWDISTRVVRFPLEDFQRIMGFGRLNIQRLRASTDSLLCKVVHLWDEDGGYNSFQLFKRCRVFKQDEQWFVEIDANDDALPLMFDFKDRYFKYELWNALRLKSPNQVRMYEILKQYENVGRRELTVQALRELLGIAPTEYAGRTGWTDFKKYVLDACQQALKECTDICYTYERGRTGQGGKWISVIFHIQKNKDYTDQLSLAEFIELQPKPGLIIEDGNDSSEGLPAPISEDNPDLDLLAEACNNEFNTSQVYQLYQLIVTLPDGKLSHFSEDIWERRYHYLAQQYAALNVAYMAKKGTANPIAKRFEYLRGMVRKDLN